MLLGVYLWRRRRLEVPRMSRPAPASRSARRQPVRGNRAPTRWRASGSSFSSRSRTSSGSSPPARSTQADFAILHCPLQRDRLLKVEAAIADLETDPSTRVPAIADASPSPDGGAARRPPADGECVDGSEAGVCGWWSGPARRACFVVAATLLAASLAGVRLPGESATGSVSLSTAQQEQETLDRAAILGSEGQVAEAVQLYDQVLQVGPEPAGRPRLRRVADPPRRAVVEEPGRARPR